MIDANQLLQASAPQLQRQPWLHKSMTWALRSLLHEQELQAFINEYPGLKGREFVEKTLEHFNFSYRTRDDELDNIPTAGRVVIIANHPIGSLDGLALLKLVSDIRPDVKILANDFLQHVEPLQSMLLPVNVFGGFSARRDLERLYQHLNADGALIIFPAGEVSRLRPAGVRDTKWRTGFLRLALKTKSPILPIHVRAHNSFWFYSASMLYKPLGTLLLVKEMFRQQQKHIDLRIGRLISHTEVTDQSMPVAVRTKLLKRHLYRIGQGKTGIYPTQSPIARPENRQQLQSELAACTLLGETADGKQILHYRCNGSSAILRELGRLRELTFRAVGEGTGKRRDLDRFDTYYQHLIVWDSRDLEIAGAYRFGDTAEIIAKYGREGLYSATLFDYNEKVEPLLAQGLELGRSFVQPRYWGKRSLDYLWQGIGAILRQQPNYRYLLGAVTISNAMPELAKQSLIHYYAHYYPSPLAVAKARTPYQLIRSTPCPLNFPSLKAELAKLGVRVPTLFKQYTELCEEGGVWFEDFNVDKDFADAIDGLVIVDITRLKLEKQQRYIKAS